MTFSSRAKWTQLEATQQHATWAISNGFRDAVEGVSSFLESAHRVATVLALSEASGGKIRFGDYKREMEGAAFHRLGLPDKIAHLKMEHQINLDSVLERHLLSINNARNCLVHRQGIVCTRLELREKDGCGVA